MAPLSKDYPYGLRIFFRTQDKDGGLHFINLPTAAGFSQDQEDPLHAIDSNKRHLGSFFRGAISMILPLDPPEPESSAKN